MRTRSSSNLIVESSTIPKRRNRRRSKQIVEPELRSIVETPAILAENFELKVGLLQLVTSSQFHGFERDDPHAHIRAARIRLEKEPPRSILTWEDLVSKFVNYFFPPSKTTNLKNDITNFQQKFDETFSEAWDRFKDILRKCPHHGFLELHQIDTFYNALTQSDQDSLNAAAGGNLLNRTPQDALTIIENKSKVHTSQNKPIVSKVSTTTSSSSPFPDITALTNIIKELMLMNKANQQASVKAVKETYVTCGGPHPYYECLATDSNTFNASAATGTYNQGAKPRGDVKAITTRSGVAYDGPTIPPTPSPLLKEVKHETEATKDKVHTTSSENTAHVQPLVVQVPILEPEVAPKPNPKLSIPYPSMLNDQKLREKANNLIGLRCRSSGSPHSQETFLEDEVLKIKKLSHHLSGSTTSTPDSSSSLTPVETKGDIHLLEKLLNNDPSSPLPSKELNFEELKTIKSSIDYFPPLDVLGGNSVISSNPLSNSNEDFTSSDDESPPKADVSKENFNIYSNPLFEFDEEYISSNVNPLFNKVLEDIESEESYVSYLDEPDLLITPLSDANEDKCFDPGIDIDEIVVSTDIEDDYHDSEGDIIYLENFLNNDTIPYLPPDVFLDHDPKSLKDELDNNDLKSMVKVFDPGIFAYSFYSLESVAYEKIFSSTCFIPNITMIWGESS
ncbi:reverse transcriptase domain-containing protein [Tanacetum coccineum]